MALEGLADFSGVEGQDIAGAIIQAVLLGTSQNTCTTAPDNRESPSRQPGVAPSTVRGERQADREEMLKKGSTIGTWARRLVLCGGVVVLRDLTEIIDMAKVPRSAALGANAGTEMRCTAFLPAREHRAGVTWDLDGVKGQERRRRAKLDGLAFIWRCREPPMAGLRREKSWGRAMDI